MTNDLNKRPRWTQRALQGVAYWMGHRRCLYRDYPLSEGALVAEVCNLIYANLPDHLELHCEVQPAPIRCPSSSSRSNARQLPKA
jgi:hypothetical protein